MENVGVKHASVEILEFLPTLHDHKPLVINVILVPLVVIFPNSLLVITSPKLKQVIIPSIEVMVCFGALGHAELEVGQSFQHLVVCFVDMIGSILLKDI